MPHLRERHCLSIALKKLAFSPVVAIQGMRQTGKSVFARELLRKRIPGMTYITLDRRAEKEFAATNPESFLARHITKSAPVVIDEAQKAPPLFDAVKVVVDENRRPGTFVLLGSTEFSKMTLIRESLTGRMSRLRIYPLNLAEATKLRANSSHSPVFANEKSRITRTQLLVYLERGGMPGIFGVRNQVERTSLLEDLLVLTLERDLQLLPKLKLDADLARRLLVAIAKIEHPDSGALARQVGKSLAVVKTHLDALATLFVIQKVLPHPDGTGKSMYVLADVGFATYFDASFERQLQTWLVQEISSQLSYRGELGANLYYYRGTRGGVVDLVIDRKASLSAIKILATEALDERQLQGLLAWKKKQGQLKMFALGAVRARVDDIEIYPWEAIG